MICSQGLGGAQQHHVEDARVAFEHLAREQCKRENQEDDHQPETERPREREVLLAVFDDGPGAAARRHGWSAGEGA